MLSNYRLLQIPFAALRNVAQAKDNTAKVYKRVRIRIEERIV